MLLPLIRQSHSPHLVQCIKIGFLKGGGEGGGVGSNLILIESRRDDLAMQA